MPKLRIRLTRSLGFVSVSCGYYDPILYSLCRDVPGSLRYVNEWTFPEEYAIAFIKACSYEGIGATIEPLPVSELVYEPALRAHQLEGARRILQQRRIILAFEQRLGKTATAITAIRNNPGHTLIVCPAIVRDVWVNELDKWWPAHPEIEVVEHAESAKIGSITITSYNLLGALLPHIDCQCNLIVDESHGVNSVQKETLRAQNVKQVLATTGQRNLAIFMTGTPFTVSPEDLFRQCDLLWPGRLGRNKWAFAGRYCNIEENQYGKRIAGIKPSMEIELNQRLAYMMYRITQTQVPNVVVAPKTDMVTVNASSIPTGTLANWVTGNLKLKEHYILRLTKHATSVCLVTNLKSTARRLVKMLNAAGRPAVLADGSIPIKKRLELLQQTNQIAVTTMHAIEVGINLSRFKLALFVELYTAPAKISQAVARFSGFGNVEPNQVTFVVVEGSDEERKARILRTRIDAGDRVVEAGAQELNVKSALAAKSDIDIVAGFLAKLERTRE